MLEKDLGKLPPEARAGLLRVLTSPPHIRADVIRQFHERGEVGMSEVLIELEADEFMRFRVIDVLEWYQPGTMR